LEESRQLRDVISGGHDSRLRLSVRLNLRHRDRGEQGIAQALSAGSVGALADFARRNLLIPFSESEIVAAVDHTPRVKTCPLAHDVELCPMYRWLDDALAMIERTMRQSSIADLLVARSHSTSLRRTEVDMVSRRR
jgi:hypothetical protein